MKDGGVASNTVHVGPSGGNKVYLEICSKIILHLGTTKKGEPSILLPFYVHALLLLTCIPTSTPPHPYDRLMVV